MITGIEMIAAERSRQTAVEGWTPEHDDMHDRGQLADAARAYVTMTPRTPDGKSRISGVSWPWSLSWWKPSPDNRVRELVKAGALIAAEIDRLERRKARGFPA